MVTAFLILILKLLPKNKRDFIVGRTNDMPFFNMIGISLGGSVTSYQSPVKNLARTLLLFWLVTALILRSSYEGKLFDHLCSNQRKSPFYNVKDLYESNLKLFVYPVMYNLTSQIVSKDR